MDVQAIVDRARRLTYLSSTQYNDTRAIEDFNIVYKDLTSRITYEVNEDFFWDKFTANLVNGQSEYLLPETVSKISWLIINYWAGNIRATEIDGNDSTKLTATYTETAPIYYIKENSVFILPEPTTDETGGLVLEGIKEATSLALIDISSSVIIPDEYHHLIAEGMKGYIYQSRGLISEKNDAVGSYENSISEMISALTDRTLNPTTGTLPNLDYYL